MRSRLLGSRRAIVVAALVTVLSSSVCAYSQSLPIIEEFDVLRTWTSAETDNTKRWLEDRQYHIAVYTEGMMAFGMRNGEPISDSKFWAEATFQNGDDGAACGLVFRLQDSSNYYCFVVTLGGLCSLQVMENGRLQTIGVWAACEVNGIGVRNELCVIAEGESLTCFVNNAEIFQVSSDTHTAGDIGFIARAFGEVPVEISCDNVSISEPSDEFQLIFPRMSNGLCFQDELISVTFWFQREAASLAEAPISEISRYFSDPPRVFKRVRFSLANASSRALSVDWGSCSYILPSGEVSGVIHEGIPLINRGQTVPATAVPSGAHITDSLTPVENLSYVSSLGWSVGRLELYEGAEFGVFFTLLVDGEAKTYDFRFRTARFNAAAE